jgi:hypothetical protein
MDTFSEILDIESSDVERPKPLPAGTYACIITGLPRFDKSPKQQIPFIEFTLQPQAPLDDVDQEELQEQGGIGERKLRVTFWIPDKESLWRLNDFLDNCGIEQGKMSARVDQTPNCSIGAVVKHKPSDDNTVMYANVVKTISL